MSVWRLVTREMIFRKLNFLLGCLSVVVAVGCLVGAMTLLRKHDLRTEHVVAVKQAELEQTLRELNDDLRKSMKKLGFNILILPKDQDLSEFYSQGYASKVMPEEYVETLAKSQIMTVRHLLPMLEQKIDWPEEKRKIILVGTRGEVPLLHRDPKKPILEAVPPGSIVLGYELHRSLGLNEGDTVILRGEEFTVQKCHGERGTSDDITAWIDLEQAQKMLDMEGKINAILALECSCAWADLSKVRADISKVLGEDVQMKEKASKAIARAEARNKAAASGKEAIEREKQSREKLRDEREAFAALLVPIVTLGSIVLIGLLAYGNVRERSKEIGVLRAIGVKSRHVFMVFLAKAIIIGLVGAVIGYFGGVLIGGSFGEDIEGETFAVALIDTRLLLLVLFAAPALAALASFIPALAAAAQDPAIVLQQE